MTLAAGSDVAVGRRESPIAPGDAIRAGRGASFASTVRIVDGGVSPLLLEDRPEGSPEALRISILAPRVDVGGGARILFEHANRLSRLGHDVVLLAHFPRPEWMELDCRYRHVPAGYDLAALLPPCDLIVCGYWDQIPGAVAASLAPVVHFEQGDFHLFEDLEPEKERLVQLSLLAANSTLAVSSRVARILADRYGVANVGVIHNAVDASVFHPAPRPGSASPYVLCVGWDGNDFKGIGEVRQVWEHLRSAQPHLRLVWVTPKPPRDGPLGDVVVSPPQDRLADLYRGAAAFLCASHYESFPLPPLEAMACGAPVVTTANVGVLEYAIHGENAIVVPLRDVDAMTGAILRVIEQSDLAGKLRMGGIRTAEKFSWDQIVTRLEGHYRELCRRRVRRDPLPAGKRRDWQLALPAAARPSGPFPDEAAALLGRAMETSLAGQILVPVARPLLPGVEVYRWEVAARRNGTKGVARVHAPHACPEPSRGLAYQAALDALAGGRAQLALDGLLNTYQRTESPSRQGAVAKWLAIALLRAGRLGDACQVAGQALAQFGDNPDFVTLWGALSVFSGTPIELNSVRATVDVLGQGTRYDDWLADPMTLIEGAGFEELLLGGSSRRSDRANRDGREGKCRY